LRYKVDLKAFMADCETNYYRLKKLMPGFADSDSFELALPGEGPGIMTLEVVERTPYTTLVQIRQQGTSTLVQWIPESCLTIRLYHDARLAEVVDWAGMRKPRPRYLYPNAAMLQPDEKAQWNRFLSEWLALAIGHGYAVSVTCDFAG